MTTVAIVLARAGSKGLARKNALPVAGRPCVAWTIEHALCSRSIDSVVVSTDDAEIAWIAQAMGAGVIRRPEHLADDRARVDDALRHAVGVIENAGMVVSARGARDVDEHTAYAALYANVPVRPADLTDRAIDLLRQSGCDSVQSVAPVGKHHPWWTACVDEQGALRPWVGPELNHGVYRRQDLPPAHVPDGGVIALTRASLFLLRWTQPETPHAFLGTDRRAVITNEGDVVDIDSERDRLVAEATLVHRATQPTGAWAARPHAGPTAPVHPQDTQPVTRAGCAG